MIIGCGGAGKSYLARRLHVITSLPLLHLDQYFWKSGWVNVDTQTWRASCDQLIAQDRWIIDGNYGSTMDARIQRADTVIYLDRSTWISLWRVIKRTFRYLGRSRPDMTEGCHERFDLEFTLYILTYNLRNRKKLRSKLSHFRHSKNIYILRNDKEVESFIESVKELS